MLCPCFWNIAEAFCVEINCKIDADNSTGHNILGSSVHDVICNSAFAAHTWQGSRYGVYCELAAISTANTIQCEYICKNSHIQITFVNEGLQSGTIDEIPLFSWCLFLISLWVRFNRNLLLTN